MKIEVKLLAIEFSSMENSLSAKHKQIQGLQVIVQATGKNRQQETH